MQDLLTADEDLAEGFRKVRFFVLDEADRLLEPSFESELRIIAGALPAQRQTLLFSATLTRSLAMLQASSLRDAHIFQVGDESLQWPHVHHAKHLVTLHALLGTKWKRDCVALFLAAWP